MDTENLASQLSQMHIDHARLLAKVSGALSTSGEIGVLLWLNQRKDDTYSIDIIDHFSLTPGRVANIVRKLEERNYIEKEQDNEDLRKSRILLTEKGKAHAAELYDQMNEGHKRVVKALGKEDAETGLRILRKIIDLVDSGIELHTLDF